MSIQGIRGAGSTFTVLLALALGACSSDSNDQRETARDGLVSIGLLGSGEGRVRSEPSGIDCPGDCSSLYPFGEPITITAEPEEGSSFEGFVLPASLEDADCSTGTSCTFVPEASRTTIGVRFEGPEDPEPVTVSIAVQGEGEGSVLSDPAGLDCPDDCSAEFPAGEALGLQAVAAEGSTFDGFSVPDGVQQFGCESGDTCVFIPQDDVQVTVSFAAQDDPVEPETAPLTVSLTGDGSGSVTSTPAGINCPDECTADFETGEAVTLQATADEGSEFEGFEVPEGVTQSGCNEGNSCTVTLDAAATVTARFEPVQVAGPVTLDVAFVGDGAGSVTSLLAGINCPDDCSESYEAGTSITLMASADDESEFEGFELPEGADAVDCAEGSECTFTLNASGTVNARFVQRGDQSLTVAIDGEGEVTSSPAGIDCPQGACDADFTQGQPVTLVADPASGWDFVAFDVPESVAGPDCASGPECTVTLGDEPVSVTATFEERTEIFVAAQGNGRITYTPPGATCRSDVCSDEVEPGAEVELVASADQDNRFAGYTVTGAEETQGCGSELTCTVTMPDGGRVEVTARFEVSVLGDLYGLTTDNKLATFNAERPETLTSNIPIAGLADGEEALAVAVRPDNDVLHVLVAQPDGEGVFIEPRVGRIFDPLNPSLSEPVPLTECVVDSLCFFPESIELEGQAFGMAWQPTGANALPLHITSDSGQHVRTLIPGEPQDLTFLETIPQDEEGTPERRFTGLAFVADGPADPCQLLALEPFVDASAVDTETARLYQFASQDACETPIASSDIAELAALELGPFRIDTGLDVVNGADGAFAFALLSRDSAQGEPRLLQVKLDAVDGAATISNAPIGENGPGSPVDLRGLAIRTAPEVPRDLLALARVGTESHLLSFSDTSPEDTESSLISGVEGGELLRGIAKRPSDQQLYALGNNGRLYTINPQNAAATLVANLVAGETVDSEAGVDEVFDGLSDAPLGMSFDPVLDARGASSLRVVSQTGQNLLIDVDGGADEETEEPIPAGATYIVRDDNQDPVDAGAIAIAFSDRFFGASQSALYLIDESADTVIVEREGVRADLATPLSPTVPSGLFVAAETNEAFIAASDRLSSLDLGAANPADDLGDIDEDIVWSTMSGLEARATFAAEITALSRASAGEGIELIRLRPEMDSGEWIETQRITLSGSGLQTAEQFIGVGFRQINGLLYGVTSADRVFTINPDNGVATRIGPLAGDDFPGLDGTVYGVGFNPVDDRLELFGAAGDALSASLTLRDDGSIIVDTERLDALGGAGTAGLAFSNNFVQSGPGGGPGTQRYVLDAGELVFVGDAMADRNSCGALQEEGAEGPEPVAGVARSLDIVGGNNGLAVALFQDGGTARLYTINLPGDGCPADMLAQRIWTGSDDLSGLALRLVATGD